MRGKSVIFNTAGSIFDKGIPLLVSTLLTKYISTDDYGHWSLFYNFMIISNALCIGPTLTIFSRKFYIIGESDNHIMPYYFFKSSIIIQILCFAVYFLFFHKISYASIFEILAVILSNFYAYLSLFYRFNGKDWEYSKQSFLRIVLFIFLLSGLFLYSQKITYIELLAIFSLMHIISIVKVYKHIRFPKHTEFDDIKEYVFLLVYGFASSIMTGIDRFIIVNLGYNYSFLGYYSFIYTISNTPGVIVEAFKKTVNPVMFKDLSNDGNLSKKTIRYITMLILVLLLIQFFIPQLLYFLLRKTNMLNISFIDNSSYVHIFILSLGFFFAAIYQVINPYYFFYKKTHYLLGILLFSLLVYFTIMMIFWKYKRFTQNELMWFKSGLLILITISFLIVLLITKKHQRLTVTNGRLKIH